MTRHSIKIIAACGVLAALYAAITVLTASFAYGPIQFRIADALCVVVCIEPSLSIGLFLGCFSANFFSTVSALDIVVGSLATLLACLWMTRIKQPFLTPIPNIVVNGVFVGAMLSFVYTPDHFLRGFVLMGSQVALGEACVMIVLGVPLLLLLRRLGAKLLK